MSYQPGLHILSRIYTTQEELLVSPDSLRTYLSEEIKRLDLHAVGEVYHSFDGGGYTGVVCLTESHIAFHTWPEFGLLTVDVFLSNYQKNNESKARDFWKSIQNFFQSSEFQYEEVYR
ncbi:MAG: S-adenosylmethionine decarboxylase [Cytophagaceae bacterium]|nr:S-adenosylmethionine decarboxylase [Cytophagaceae bacterium]